MKLNTKWVVLLSLTLAVQGKVLSFNAKWVQIVSADGHKQYVPRRSIVEKGPLQEDSLVTARFSLQELDELAESWPGVKTTTREQK